MVVSLLNGCLAVDGATSLTAAESIYGLQTGGRGSEVRTTGNIREPGAIVREKNEG